MPNVDKHIPGSFCWIELGTTDQAAAKTFYNALFGWTAVDFPMGPGEFYTMFSLQGRNAAAAYTIRPEQKAHGVPPHWMIYVAVESADDTCKRAASAGGKILNGPFDVFTFGRIAVVQDPTGAVFSIWQAASHQGTGTAGVDGTLCWADLNTPDADRAKAFYSEVFGWNFTLDENDSSGYLHIKNGEEYIGGIPPADTQSADVPPHWLAYFLVSDCDASTDKAKQLGAKACLEPMTLEKVGRFAVLADPQCAAFSIFQPLRHG